MNEIYLVIAAMALFVMATLFKKTPTCWYTAYFCTNCGKQLGNHTRMYSSGRCPHCGYRKTGDVTMITCRERACRKIYKRPWYIFWEKPTIEYQD